MLNAKRTEDEQKWVNTRDNLVRKWIQIGLYDPHKTYSRCSDEQGFITMVPPHLIRPVLCIAFVFG